MKNTVLIVDDSIYMRSLIRTALEGAGYEIIGEAATANAAIESALELKPDLITLDNILPDMKGYEIIKILREEGLESKIVAVSAVGQQAVVDNVIRQGALEYIVKPFTPEQLIKAVSSVMQTRQVA